MLSSHRKSSLLIKRLCSNHKPTPEAIKTIRNLGATDTTNKLTTSLGNQQELFFIDGVSKGSIFFQSNGKHIFETLKNFITAQSVYKYGFQQVETPLLYKKELWEKSGHWGNYKSEMFRVQGYRQVEQGDANETFSLKPMNCPGHAMIFKKKLRSYQDLPLRLYENSPLHRNELAGALMGLTRLRKFHQDDGHIFCRQNQIESELKGCLEFLDLIYTKVFKFDYELEISTRPEENYLGEIAEWEVAESALKKILESMNKPYTINKGDGAFYGPKIDCKITDNNGKKHQVATIQLDFQLPKNFELEYINEAGKPEKPIMIHRAIFGSIERFMAILLDHHKGDWPFWLNPKQLAILPIKVKEPEFIEHAKKLNDFLIKGGSGELVKKSDYHFRSYIDSKDVRIGGRIRDNIVNQRAGFLAIIGEKEIAENKYSFRSRQSRDLQLLTKEEIYEQLKKAEDSFE